jgi:DNA processing protein
MDQITEQGLLLSEYEPGKRPDRHHFPKRNRIIAAWSQKILVVEAGIRGGALITADVARQHGREVLAVPGRLDASESVGTNELIAKGASIFLNQEQLLLEDSKQDTLDQTQVPVHHKSEKINPQTNEEKELLRFIQNASGSMPVSIEKITKKLQFSKEEVLEMLLVLELQDVVVLNGDKVQLL